MGMFKDIRSMQKTAKEMVPPEHRGVAGGFRALKDTAAMGAQMMGNLQAANETATRLRSTGKPGTAVVTSATQTGAYINDSPQVHLGLQVTVDGATYPAETDAIIPIIQIPQVQPGATLAVLVDPADPKVLMLA
ncbi:MAG TPA: hypothetical protein VG650_08580 [Mycobacteriales bacterium]|nr:hypothetical protein [Mycobacteriales bacterium]